MIFIVLAGFITSFLAPLLYRLLGRYVYVPMVLLPLAIFVCLCSFLPEVLAGQYVQQEYVWVSSLNINLQFYLDGLALFFALLISGFGTLVMLYAKGYLDDHPLLGRFYLYLTLFMTAMLGLVMSDNIFSLFVFWELTSISSYLLIGFKHKNETSRTSAWQALLVTGGGGLALMGGLILLGIGNNSYTLSDILVNNGFISHNLYLPALILILLGCFTKSAQFPFHFWLPNAMEAPTPVSAYLHSATMVKAGIYLLARLSPLLGGSEVWQYTLLLVGGVTAVMGALLALQKTDVKAILAYTTISALGLLVTMIGLNSELALEGMLVFLLAHALYKGTLFMVAGAVDHSTGTREVQELYGLGRQMKPVAIAATLAGLSMAGLLPFLGFIGKELLYEAALEDPAKELLAFAVTFIAGSVFACIATLVGYRLFWSKSTNSSPVKHAPGAMLYLPPLLLGTAGLAFGLWPELLATPILHRAAQSITGNTELLLELTLWHGFTLVLGLSLLTLLVGLLLYRFLPRLHQFAPALEAIYTYGPNNLYHKGIAGFLNSSRKFIGWLQNGYLRSYVATIVLTFSGLVLYTTFRNKPELALAEYASLLKNTELYEIIIMILMVAGLIFLMNTRSRLTSIVVMGLVGYSAALFYILFGAPDVAATQLLIETLTVVIFVLLLHKLPAFTYLSHVGHKYKYIFVSVIFGATMTYVLLFTQQHAVGSPLKDYYGQASYLEAHGRNIVNVILVDFRGLDTLGEITVLAIAALGIVGLLRLNPEKGGKR
ncbi:hydrogen gas-evolving membrane-bound hydrogenase subunit E [Pontibacter silvestris]|uniref:Hydrogen gas-evolving membrane-bound hydrogenase subunit E n=1 Tax=Pontibacter silvestris TaxID=2305183 RepID=A0ABW4X0L9_9BACT|nr:hydrogen gas-evolving membrane-bound hydrogenase subunit E [Pontibacter silvestris]MCC9135322.1 DUF4040 domain-containing protein [Pontibacter silvestris]